MDKFLKWIKNLLKKEQPMIDKNKLIQDLERDEGIVLHEYKDHLGYSTIGIGRLIDKRKGGGISKEEAYYLLSNDIKRKTVLLLDSLPWLRDHPEPVQRALANMAFQMGVHGLLKFKNTLSLIEQKRYNEAADNALKSLWARQTPNRAQRVTDLIRSQQKDN